MKIAASILDCDFGYLFNEIKNAEAAGVDLFHLDIMDGHFVPNLSFGVPILKTVRPITKLPIASHLMVKEPEKLITKFLTDSDKILFHWEATNSINQCIDQIRKGKKVCGMAINPDTNWQELKDYLSQIDELLFMSVYPGFGGQEFIFQTLEKVRSLKEYLRHNNLNLLISIDGGVSFKNARQLKETGVDILVAGTAIFKSSDYEEAVLKLRCIDE